MDTDELSGFNTYFEEQFIVYLNSTFTLGHERYTGAHELYHLTYNAYILKKEKILLDDEKHKSEDTKADVFASEFLMSEDYVKEVFYKIVNVDKNNTLPRLWLTIRCIMLVPSVIAMLFSRDSQYLQELIELIQFIDFERPLLYHRNHIFVCSRSMVRSFGGRDSLCYKENIGMVTFEDFMKLDIRVGEII